MSEVSNIIKFDREIRYNQKYDTVENADLYTLDSINTSNTWRKDFPCLCSNEQYNPELLNNLDNFKKEFDILCPHLVGIDWSNILVAGGCISRCLYNNANKVMNDIDIFIYIENDDLATELVHKIIKHIIYQKKHEYGTNNYGTSNLPEQLVNSVSEDKLDIKFSRNKYSLDIDNYQIHFRRYSSKSEILHGFDLGSCAVGFDGTNVYFTSLSKFAFETGYNIIDTTRRSNTYESRLIKYFKRGFGIIMPEFDMSKLSSYFINNYYNSTEICELPLLCFSYTNIINNTIIISKFHKKRMNSFDMDEYDDPLNNSVNMSYNNLKKIANNQLDDIIYTSNTSTEILNPKLTLDAKFIRQLYDSMYNRIVTSGLFPINLINNYMPNIIIDDIFSDRKNKEYIKELVESQKNNAINGLNIINADTSIKWMSNNQLQLTSSINPIIEDSYRWYGKFYKKYF